MDKLQALKVLKKCGVKKGSSISTICMKRSEGEYGNSNHHIKLLIANKGRVEDISFFVGFAINAKIDRDLGAVMNDGGGMDMGYDVIDTLSKIMFGGGGHFVHSRV